MDLKSVRLEHCYDCDDDGDGPRVVQNEIRTCDGALFASAADSDITHIVWADLASEIARRWAACPTLEVQAKHAVDAETLKVKLRATLVPYTKNERDEAWNDGVHSCIQAIRELEQRRRAQEAGA